MREGETGEQLIVRIRDHSLAVRDPARRARDSRPGVVRVVDRGVHPVLHRAQTDVIRRRGGYLGGHHLLRRSDLATVARDIVIVVVAVVVVVLIVHLLVHRLAHRLLFRTTPRPVNVDDRQRVRRTVRVQHHRRLMRVLSQVKLQRVAIFGRVCTIGASVLINVRV